MLMRSDRADCPAAQAQSRDCGRRRLRV